LRTPEAFKLLADKHTELLQEICDESAKHLEHDLLRRPRAGFRAVNKLLGNTHKKMAIAGETDEDRLREVSAYFKSLGGDIGGDPNIKFTAITEAPSYDVSPCTLTEVKTAAKLFERGRAAGLDEVPYYYYYMIYLSVD
jgi:hypothetical protein